MTGKTRVLIIDDSAFMRRVIRQMLESDPSIAIAGVARDGAEGVEMCLSLKPDVITMDIEMPKMDGLQATGIIMERQPTPIIMVSSLTMEGAKATFDALDRGAVDYISKNLVTSALDLLKIQAELIAKVKAVARRSRVAAAISSTPDVTAPARKGFATQRVAFVAIGASTGGPRAVQEVLTRLPVGLSTAFLVTIHMPKAFTGAFADRLNGLCKFDVKEAEEGEKVRPGHVLLCPGGCQTRVKRRGVTDFYVTLSDEPPTSLYKPSVDVSMGSVAESYPGRCLGVILTGMGHDGRDGMRSIRDKGGKTLAQSEETCTVYGMPRAVIEAGLADKIVPLDKIAFEIVNMI